MRSMVRAPIDVGEVEIRSLDIHVMTRLLQELLPMRRSFDAIVGQVLLKDRIVLGDMDWEVIEIVARRKVQDIVMDEFSKVPSPATEAFGIEDIALLVHQNIADDSRRNMRMRRDLIVVKELLVKFNTKVGMRSAPALVVLVVSKAIHGIAMELLAAVF